MERDALQSELLVEQDAMIDNVYMWVARVKYFQGNCCTQSFVLLSQDRILALFRSQVINSCKFYKTMNFTFESLVTQALLRPNFPCP